MAQENVDKVGATASERFYAFDGLRATMLSSVVLYHCLLSYIVAPSRNWRFKDETTTITADLAERFLDVFQMPIFFILAGFFAAMLYLERGGQTFLENRAARIALPFALGVVLLHPFVSGGFVFAQTAQASHSFLRGLDAFGRGLVDGSLLLPDGTMHLWFMYDLTIFYVAMLAIAPIIMRLPAAWRESTLTVFGAVIARPWLRLPVLALTTIAMVRFVSGPLYASLSFVPNWRLLLGYALFFGFGWLLYLKREQIPRFERFAWTHIVIGLAIFFFAGAGIRILANSPATRPLFLFLTVAIDATVLWLLFAGFTGLYLRHFNRPAPSIRYIADASFWIYLIHLPLTIWLPGLFFELALPPWIKILMVLSITYVVGLVTYDLLVRSTVVGLVLNGRRYPRTFFGARQSVPA